MRALRLTASKRERRKATRTPAEASASALAPSTFPRGRARD